MLKAKENQAIDPAWLQRAMAAAQFTPDILKLEQRMYQLFFMPDELQRRHRKYPLIDGNNRFLFHAFTEQTYSAWMKNLHQDSFPIYLPTKSMWADMYSQPALVKGEVHAVKTDQIYKLDNYKMNGVMYTRKHINVLVPHHPIVWTKEHGMHRGEERVVSVRVWMYVGIPKYWDDIIDAGYVFKSLKPYTPNKKNIGDLLCDKYYCFTTKEFSRK